MRTVSFTLNGKPTKITTDEKRPLLWVLRDDLGLTGTKFGCGASYCGSCTVVVDKTAVRSCNTLLSEVDGKTVTTIEGLANGNALHPIQQAFADHNGFQCGFCTPGMIMTAYALLEKTPNAAPTDIARGLERHICRCGANPRIIDAVASVAASPKGRE